MTILVLAESKRQWEHFKRFYHISKDVRIYAPQSEMQLCGIRPDAVIELPDWIVGKSEAFINRADIFMSSLQSR